ncbi:hypothetical protein Tco_0987412 [Tanacetum coccineum]
MENQQKLLEDLNQIWIGSYKLFASMARFEKKAPVQRTRSVNYGPCSYHVTDKASYEKHANGSRSSAATLKGKMDPNKKNTETVRDIHLILNINEMLRREGFSEDCGCGWNSKLKMCA